MELSAALLELAAERSRNTVGGMLGGIVHNLNNPVHALAMQAELLQNALGREGLDTERPKLQEKCTRLQRLAQELRIQLETLAWRDIYVSPERQLIDPVHYGSWLLQFWQGNLLFKHSISPTFISEPQPPHVQAIPLGLTWCLEEPLSALVRAMQSAGFEGMVDLVLECGPVSDSDLAIRMATHPPRESTAAIHGEIRHLRELQEMTTGLGWSWEAFLEQGELAVRVVIPGKKPEQRGD